MTVIATAITATHPQSLPMEELGRWTQFARFIVLL